MTISIQSKVARLQTAIAKAQREIAKLQAECLHPNVFKEYRSNTGNYDPSCDQYWIDYHCPDCDKHWQGDQ